MQLTRRELLGASILAAPATLAGCAGFSTPEAEPSSATGRVTFTTWGTDAELEGFRTAIASFEAANTGVKVQLNAVPYDQMFTSIDAQLQSNTAPDVFRVPYYTFGSYAARGQLLDLGPHLGAGVAEGFTPAAWQAVQADGKPYGVPHHTDTSVILYNTALLKSAGITSIPTQVEDAWTWQEFADVAQKLRGVLPASKYPFVYNWQGNGVTRWLSWLFESDGRFLSQDLTSAAIDSPAAREAVEFTQSFFTKKFVPPNTSVKATTLAADVFYSQTAAMTFGGAFLVPDATSTLDFEWGATFPPRNKRSAGDFGGNALVATSKVKDPKLVASFLEHMTAAEQMRDFCSRASLLPTRRDLVASGIEFKVRPELSPVFIAQAGTVRPEDSGQVASPSMSKIIAVLKDQLEEAFVGGKDVESTIRGLNDGITAAISQ